MRRLLAVLAASVALLGATLALPAAGAGAQQDGEDADRITAILLALGRYGGADRYETSLLVAEQIAANADDQLENVVLVSGERWTDAVVAAPLAGSLGAPVLMVPPDELRLDALKFLQRVGVSKAIAVGSSGEHAGHGPGFGISDTVLAGLRSAGILTERIAGADRFGTGVAVAERLTPGEMPGFGRTAIVASGDVFADALVAGPFAVQGTHPILLTPPSELHPDVAGYLDEADIEHVVVMGGTAALDASVEEALTDAGLETTRLAGATRYDTATLAAELVENRYPRPDGERCFASDSYGIARADLPFDSFSAAPLLGQACASLLLTDPESIPVPTAVYLDLKLQRLSEIEDADVFLAVLFVFGGDAAVQQSSIETYQTEAAERIAQGRAGQIDDETESAGASEPGAEPDDSASAPAPDCGGAIDDEPSRLVPSTNAEDPAWSPDCSRLVYTQDGSLWTVANDGTDRRRLLRTSGDYLNSPAWSPDGERIAYVRGYQDGSLWVSHIWTVKADGTDRTKLTHGDANRDRWPRWSPDGTQIVFDRTEDGDRFIATMNAEGKQEKALTAGGEHEQAPAWSPDGTKLAYISVGSVHLADADGSNAYPAILDAYPRGELTWSPSGNRIAYARGAADGSSIWISDLDGTSLELVTSLEGQALAPRWSPDGELIAFHTITSDGKHRSFIVGASGEPDPWRTNCRLDSSHPWPDGELASTGTVRVAVLFVDFSDAAASHSTQEEADVGLPYIEEYLEASSYGKLDVEFVPVHRWLRADHTAAENIETHSFHLSETNGEITDRAVSQAADDIDFSTVDTTMVVFPSSHFQAGITFEPKDVGGKRMPVIWMNTVPEQRPRVPGFWGDSGANLIGRFAGLPTLSGYRGTTDIEPRAGEAWVYANWGLMGFDGYFLAPEEHAGLVEVWNFANGETIVGHNRWLKPEEMLAWNRWHLDWLEDDQVSCVTGREATVELSPIAEPGDGVAMVVIPQNSYSAIVLESRREQGYDADRQIHQQDGTRATLPNLIEEGVLAYTVNTSLGSGQRPVKFAGEAGQGWLAEDPIVANGETIILGGYEISVVDDDGDTHTVRITKVN